MKPIEKVMIHSKAAQAIEQYIRDQGLKNGSRLPSERKMASMLGIGRNSLREALRTLETMNLVEVVNGKGVFVKDIHATSSIYVQIATAKVNFLELLDIRKVLEAHAIELAVKHATEEDLKEIKSFLLAMEDKYKKGIYPLKEDTAFHHAIYKASHNQTLFDLIKPLADTFSVLWEPFGEQETMLLMKTIPFHRPLYEAIKNRKIRDAKKAFNTIIDMGEQTIINYKL